MHEDILFRASPRLQGTGNKRTSKKIKWGSGLTASAEGYNTKRTYLRTATFQENQNNNHKNNSAPSCNTYLDKYLRGALPHVMGKLKKLTSDESSHLSWGGGRTGQEKEKKKSF